GREEPWLRGEPRGRARERRCRPRSAAPRRCDGWGTGPWFRYWHGRYGEGNRAPLPAPLPTYLDVGSGIVRPRPSSSASSGAPLVIVATSLSGSTATWTRTKSDLAPGAARASRIRAILCLASASRASRVD